MSDKPKKGNPRDNQKAKIDANVARARAFKSKGNTSAKSGNPRDNIRVISKDDANFSVTSVGEVNRQAKKNERKRKKTRVERRKELKDRTRKNKKISKARLAIIALLTLVVLGISAYIVLITTDVVEIQEVEYVGADHLTREECDALVQSPIGSSLINFDAEKIKAGLIRDAWVKNVKFKRDFPHKLQIIIEEKPIAAYVDFASGAEQVSQTWILATDGTWIMGVPSKDSETGEQISQKIFEDSETCIHITDCPNGVAPKIAASCTDETILNALEIINGFTTSLKDDIKSISVPNITATTLKLKNNVEIAFGEASDIRDKERIAREIISQNSSVVYINVRSTERPTWKSVESSNSSSSEEQSQ